MLSSTFSTLAAEPSGFLIQPGRVGVSSLLSSTSLYQNSDVVGAERLAVGPLRALAQLDRPDLVVGRGLGRLGDLRLDLGAVGREAEQRVVDHAHVVVGVGRAEERAAPHAAILADLVDHRHDQRVLRQAGIDGRQLAGLDLLGQRRRFLILAALRQGRFACRHQASPHQQPNQRKPPFHIRYHGRPPDLFSQHIDPAELPETQSDAHGSQGYAALLTSGAPPATPSIRSPTRVGTNPALIANRAQTLAQTARRDRDRQPATAIGPRTNATKGNRLGSHRTGHTNQTNELPPPHPITSSGVASNPN